MNNIEEWLKTLYVPKSARGDYDKLLAAVRNGSVRQFSKYDKGIDMPAVQILIAGKAPRATFKGFSRVIADSGGMGEKWGFLAILDNDGIAHPVKFKYSANKYLIIERKF